MKYFLGVIILIVLLFICYKLIKAFVTIIKKLKDRSKQKNLTATEESQEETPEPLLTDSDENN